MMRLQPAQITVRVASKVVAVAVTKFRLDAMAAQDRYIKAEAYRVASEAAEVTLWHLRQSVTGPGR